jgi:hypothetical protein
MLRLSVSQFIPNHIAIDVSQVLDDLDVQAVTVFSQFDDLERAADLDHTMTDSTRGNAQGWLQRDRIAKAFEIA